MHTEHNINKRFKVDLRVQNDDDQMLFLRRDRDDQLAKKKMMKRNRTRAKSWWTDQYYEVGLIDGMKERFSVLIEVKRWMNQWRNKWQMNIECCKKTCNGNTLIIC